MKYTVTGTQMKEIDRYSIEEFGIPSLVLMERAALAVSDAVCVHLNQDSRVLCVCGSGNNGADGLAIARILFCRGFQAEILLAGDQKQQTGEFSTQLKIVENLGISVLKQTERQETNPYNVIVDGMFGTGLTRVVQGHYQEVIDWINSLDNVFVTAVDIPSGIHADTGEVMGTAVRADETVTFGCAKTGQLLYPGKQYCGKLIVCDIGFPPAAFERAGWDTVYYGPGDEKLLPGRPAYSHKGTYGRVLVAAGSIGMCGAAYFSALAAYRMGAGIVKLLTVEDNRSILQALLPEAMVETYLAAQIYEDPDAFREMIKKQCEWATVIVLGPGLGLDAYVEALVSAVLTQAYVPIVLDADGLNIIARYPHLTGYFTENIIVTPHLGEMARLTGKETDEVSAGLLMAAKDYAARYGVTCVLKDAVTVVADKDGLSYLNTSGCSAMAKGGSGDVLTGIIAGLLALGMEEGEAARLGVWLHGCAGEQAASERGVHGVTASDLLDCLTKTMEATIKYEPI